MKRVNEILKHPLFIRHLAANEAAEADRIYCHHDMNHFLDVARIATIRSLELELDLPREVIYAAALLHDIGRHIQYESGVPHELSSAEIAPEILLDCGYNKCDACLITDAIRSHRDASVREERSLRGILYFADKKSRPCFACKAEGQCDWKADKKNKSICY